MQEVDLAQRTHGKCQLAEDRAHPFTTFTRRGEGLLFRVAHPWGVLVCFSLLLCEAAFSEGTSGDPSKRRVHVAPSSPWFGEDGVGDGSATSRRRDSRDVRRAGAQRRKVLSERDRAYTAARRRSRAERARAHSFHRVRSYTRIRGDRHGRRNMDMNIARRTRRVVRALRLRPRATRCHMQLGARGTSALPTALAKVCALG